MNDNDKLIEAISRCTKVINNQAYENTIDNTKDLLSFIKEKIQKTKDIDELMLKVVVITAMYYNDCIDHLVELLPDALAEPDEITH